MPAYHPTKDEIRFLDEQAAVIENFIKERARAAFDQCGPELAMNVLLNAGITTIAGALSAIEKDSERLATTINTFIAVVHEIKLEMAESAAESIIKKAMKK
jgi:DNA mismatch repair ATPase MutL